MSEYERNQMNRTGRRNRGDGSSVGWIVGSLIALALLIGAFYAFSGNMNSQTASNQNNAPAAQSTPATPAPSTTGSAPARP
jgi:hypothetical protein